MLKSEINLIQSRPLEKEVSFTEQSPTSLSALPVWGKSAVKNFKCIFFPFIEIPNSLTCSMPRGSQT